jgi:hypothetical protein
MIPILFLAADPTDVSRLRLGEEFREIQEKLQLSKGRARFDLHQRTAVRPADISQALLDVEPKIVHFSGHGTAAGALCFEDQLGSMHPIPPEPLAALFEQFSDQVECVVLNACYSIAQAEAIARHIEYVIGMNQAIGDRAAIAFSIGFYQALGAQRSIEKAYRLGCVQVRLQNIPEHLTPVLAKKGSILQPTSSVASQSSVQEARGSARSVQPPAVARPYNLSFEGPTIGGMPSGWFNSEGYVSRVSTAYETQVVARLAGGMGACVVFRNYQAHEDEFGSLMQRCPAHHLVGRRLRFQGEVKTKGVQEWAGLWLRADGVQMPALFFDNMHQRPIRGTTDWTLYAIDAQLPQGTAWLNYGIVLSGRGAIWADNFRLMVRDSRGWVDI